MDTSPVRHDEASLDQATRDALIPQKTPALQEKLVHLLPRARPEVDYVWAGSFGAPPAKTISSSFRRKF